MLTLSIIGCVNRKSNKLSSDSPTETVEVLGLEVPDTTDYSNIIIAVNKGGLELLFDSRVLFCRWLWHPTF